MGLLVRLLLITKASAIVDQLHSLWSAVSPQLIHMPSVTPNPTNTADLQFLTLPNDVNSIKLAGVVVRDEEVVGSNPATPTRVSKAQTKGIWSGPFLIRTDNRHGSPYPGSPCSSGGSGAGPLIPGVAMGISGACAGLDGVMVIPVCIGDDGSDPRSETGWPCRPPTTPNTLNATAAHPPIMVANLMPNLLISTQSIENIEFLCNGKRRGAGIYSRYGAISDERRLPSSSAAVTHADGPSCRAPCRSRCHCHCHCHCHDLGHSRSSRPNLLGPRAAWA